MGDWRHDQAEIVRGVVTESGLSMSKSVDDDGDVSVIVYWDGSGSVHCRAYFGFDENGSDVRYSFYSFCYQGIGGVGTPILSGDAAETAADRFARGCVDYRKIIEAVSKK